ncbi:MAG: CotH kinase family protein [Kineosporiaceae bacterium]
MSLRRTRPALLAVGLALALPLSAVVLVPAEAVGGNARAAVTAPDGQASPAKEAEEDPMLGDVAFSVPSQTFTGSLQVTLSTTQAGATVRYTTDGSAPTASSPAATGALTLTATTRLRAQAFAGSTAAGAPSSAFYLRQAVTQQHDLPVVVMDDFGKGKPTKQSYVDAALMVFEGAGTVTPSGVPTLTTRAGFKLRGQSSSMFDKPQYRLELRDNADDDVDLPVLGMPAESDWVLRGPYADKSLVRNALMFDLARDLGRYAPRYRFVELYLNTGDGVVGPEDYVGVYMMMETIKNQKDRLDLKKLKEDDVTAPAIEGGYIFKVEWRAAEQPIISCTGTTPCFNDVELYDPDDAVPAQLAWISDHLSRFHARLHGTNIADPTNGYPSWIDVGSFVDTVILEEFSRNQDAYVRSAYFSKDRGGLITSGPGWDWDLTFSTGGTYSNDQISGWQYDQVAAHQPVAADWFPVLMADPAFANQVRARWQELRRGPLSDAALDAKVASITAPLANAAGRNFQRWDYLTTPVLGIYRFKTSTEPTWQGQVGVMKTWMHQRAAWLDSTAGWGGATTPTPTRTTPGTTTKPPTSTPPTTTKPVTSKKPTTRKSTSKKKTTRKKSTRKKTTTRKTTRKKTTRAAAVPASLLGSGPGCTVSYRLVSAWPSGSQALVTLTADAPASGWAVVLPDGSDVTQVSGADVARTPALTLRSPAAGPGLAAGDSVTISLVSGEPGPPDGIGCRLN